jgi:ketosteroid isomerase-like protein
MVDDYHDSFVTDLDHVLDAGDHLVAPITITARGKTSDSSIVAENVWVIELRDGNFAQAQNYADTAASVRTAS